MVRCGNCGESDLARGKERYMRLSDAIALGRTLIKARAGSTYFDDGSGCAIGMGIAAIGKRDLRASDALNAAGWEWTTAFPIPAVMPCGCKSKISWNTLTINGLGCQI